MSRKIPSLCNTGTKGLLGKFLNGRWVSEAATANRYVRTGDSSLGIKPKKTILLSRMDVFMLPVFTVVYRLHRFFSCGTRGAQLSVRKTQIKLRWFLITLKATIFGFYG